MIKRPRIIRRLLAANRSEIAIRICGAATELSIRTVAICAEQDKLSLHRFKADETYLVGAGRGPPAGQARVGRIWAVCATKSGPPG